MVERRVECPKKHDLTKSDVWNGHELEAHDSAKLHP